jgi:hypothetical protein
MMLVSKHSRKQMKKTEAAVSMALLIIVVALAYQERQTRFVAS